MAYSPCGAERNALSTGSQTFPNFLGAPNSVSWHRSSSGGHMNVDKHHRIIDRLELLERGLVALALAACLLWGLFV